MNAKAPAIVSLGTVALIDAIKEGSAEAKTELLRRVAKGSRFAVKAARKMGLLADNEAAADPSADDIVKELKKAAGKK